MAKIETTKEKIQPAMRIANSSGVKLKPNPINFRKLAPNITGMERKKEYSAAIGRAVPISIAPTIVAPERDVPGINARTWKKPIIKAVL